MIYNIRIWQKKKVLCYSLEIICRTTSETKFFFYTVKSNHDTIRLITNLLMSITDYYQKRTCPLEREIEENSLK